MVYDFKIVKMIKINEKFVYIIFVFVYWSFVLREGRAVILIRSGAFWERQQGRHFCSAGWDTSP